MADWCVIYTNFYQKSLLMGKQQVSFFCERQCDHAHVMVVRIIYQKGTNMTTSLAFSLQWTVSVVLGENRRRLSLAGVWSEGACYTCELYSYRHFMVQIRGAYFTHVRTIREILQYTLWVKKDQRYYSFVTLANVDEFPIFFHLWIQQEICNKTLSCFSPHVNHVATLLCET